jgi:integrase
MNSTPYHEFQKKLGTYNRDSALTSGEVAALPQLLTGDPRTRMHRLRKHHHTLERLLQPIEDVLEIMGAPRLRVRNTLIECFMHEIQSQGTAYWAWTQDNWTEWLHRLETANIPRHQQPVRYYIVAAAYLLCGYDRFWAMRYISVRYLAEQLFGTATVNDGIEQVNTTLIRIGYGQFFCQTYVGTVFSLLVLLHRSAHLQTFRLECLENLYREPNLSAYIHPTLERISHALFAMNVLSHSLTLEPLTPRITTALTGVPPAWADWCQRWRETSPCATGTRYRRYYTLLQVGRWLAETHPEITSPEQWTREIAAEFIATVDRMHKGQYALNERHHDPNTPLSANAKKNIIATISVFFQDCQEWEWLKRRFDPRRSFRVASHIIAASKTPPRVMSDDVWAKLMWAGLNLTESDIEPYNLTRDSLTPVHIYPVEMLQALVMIWLFAGLRSDEIRRLRVGCVRWQRPVGASSEQENPQEVCLLEVPAHKTGPAFTKPVDGLVGRAIQGWEQLRPELPPMVDHKTGERVHYLFVYRAKRMGRDYINKVLIPILCKKAGIPLEETRGRITSHRARSTIATQLFNAKDPMSLFELQSWLGHRSPQATQRYIQLTPAHLTQAYTNADYFKRNLRRIEVLIDQEAILSGAAAAGEAWKFYDLGHGYCTYDFFDQCPHRMACAKCDFYRPKGTSQAQLLEAKSNLQRMMQEIPLTDDECAAVEDGLQAVERLMQKLVDVPTPSGQTPRQLDMAMGFVPLEAITTKTTI